MTTSAEPDRGDQPWIPTGRTFAQRLRMVRVELGITTVQAAAQCGIIPATWSKWEAGARPRDVQDVVLSIARGTGVDPHWLMWGSTPEVPRHTKYALRDSNPEPTDSLARAADQRRQRRQTQRELTNGDVDGGRLTLVRVPPGSLELPVKAPTSHLRALPDSRT